MITMPVVEQCPHTVTGLGVIKASHSVLATLAGAVHDRDEWIALLIGKRSANGLEIQVDSLRIPLQERSHAACSLVRQEPLTPDVVGVIHSHHSMGAFFSTTDDETLNTRFPMSLVVAQTRHDSPMIEQLLGFNYKAEGRAILPCGSIGIVPFRLIPIPAIAEWPETLVPGFTTPAEQISLRLCPHTTKSLTGFTHHCTTPCGIERTEAATTIFGSNGKDFLKEVQTNTRGFAYNRGNGLAVVDNRMHWEKKRNKHDVWSDDDFIRRWGEGGYY
jgi:JAB domain-containing protein similar to deubiquitination enzymes